MAAKKRTAAQIEHDRKAITQLYLAGQSQIIIGQQLGLCQQQISYDLKAIKAHWLESTQSNIDEKISLELAKLDNLEGVYWGLFGVKEDLQTLQGIERIIAARCKLMGLNGAAKIDITSGGNPLDEVLSRALSKAYGSDEDEDSDDESRTENAE